MEKIIALRKDLFSTSASTIRSSHKSDPSSLFKQKQLIVSGGGFRRRRFQEEEEEEEESRRLARGPGIIYIDIPADTRDHKFFSPPPRPPFSHG